MKLETNSVSTVERLRPALAITGAVRSSGGDCFGVAMKRDRTGANNSNWKGGEITDGRGRVLIYKPGHHLAHYCGTHVFRYRIVAEEMLGRPLDPNEIVHHKNSVNSDDRPENLEVMTQAEHARIHMTERQRNKKGRVLKLS